MLVNAFIVAVSHLHVRWESRTPETIWGGKFEQRQKLQDRYRNFTAAVRGAHRLYPAAS